MNRIASVRFILFSVTLVAAPGVAVWLWHPLKASWGLRCKRMVFLLSSVPLLNANSQEIAPALPGKRRQSDDPPGHPIAVTTVILVSVGGGIAKSETLQVMMDVVMIVATLALGVAVRKRDLRLPLRAHMFYSKAGGKGDAGALSFPGRRSPITGDFPLFRGDAGHDFPDLRLRHYFVQGS